MTAVLVTQSAEAPMLYVPANAYLTRMTLRETVNAGSRCISQFGNRAHEK